MKIITKKISDLKAAKYNPRRISPEAMKGLEKSIEKWGCVEPIVVNKKTGNVVGGHQRLAVLKKQGVKTVDVVEVNLSEKEEKALNISLNNPHITGEFTDDLQALLDDLKIEIPEFEELNLGELLMPEIQPPTDFSDYDENIKTEYECPKCHYKWSGKPK